MSANADALAYFITFACYGTWLHGDERGSFHRRGPDDTVPVRANEARRASAVARLKGDPVTLDRDQRRVVDAAIRETCEFHGWLLKALNVRTNHVHLVVAADVPPPRVMNTVKGWATTRLKQAGLVPREAEVWSRRGSRRLLFRDRDVSEACWYVLERQGPDLL